MKRRLTTGLLLSLCWLASCSSQPDAPALSLTDVEGGVIELNAGTPLTAILFFSISNPVALGAFERLPDRLDPAADSFAVATDVDRPPNVRMMQQRTLLPIVIDTDGRIGEAFGGIDLTPTLILVREGKVVLHQRGRLDYPVINATIDKYSE